MASSRKYGAGLLSGPKGGATPGKASGRIIRTPQGYSIETLERGRILERTSAARRDRVYCARAILDILEEPARLSAL
jgi:hypothetical protein